MGLIDPAVASLAMRFWFFRTIHQLAMTMLSAFILKLSLPMDGWYLPRKNAEVVFYKAMLASNSSSESESVK